MKYVRQILQIVQFKKAAADSVLHIFQTTVKQLIASDDLHLLEAVSTCMMQMVGMEDIPATAEQTAPLLLGFAQQVAIANGIDVHGLTEMSHENLVATITNAMLQYGGIGMPPIAQVGLSLCSMLAQQYEKRQQEIGRISDEMLLATHVDDSESETEEGDVEMSGDTDAVAATP